MNEKQLISSNLFETIEIGIVYQDSNGKILASNPAAEKILGYSPEKITGINMEAPDWGFVKPDGSTVSTDELPSMIALNTGKIIKDSILGVYNPEKAIQVWLNINAVPEFQEGEEKPFRVFVTFNDITDRFLMERKMKETEEKFKALFENSPIGVAYHRMVYDTNGNAIDYYFLDANENYQKLTGIDPRGKLVTEAFPGIENDPADWIGTFARAGRDGEVIRFQQHLEPVDRWYDAVGFQSSPDHFVAAFLEITEQKKKEIELERLKNELEDKVKERTRELEEEKERAEAANRAKTTFLANMSHELRTPLNAVLGYADILKSKEYDETRQQYLNSISTSGNALLSLINDVLDLSKIETGKFELQHSVVALKTLFEEINIIFNKKITDKGLAFTISTDPSVPEHLLLDEVRLRQILINLVGNAVKFTEKGYIAIRCSPLTKENSGPGEIHLKIEVEDTGRGIVKSELKRIFNAFEQAKQQKVSEYEGTGLGLAISKNLAELMQGEIQVESTPGKGSLFTLIIRHVEIISDKEKIRKKKLLDPESVTFKGGKVLITDDIDYNRDMMGTYLQPYNFELSFASNGKEALEIIKNETPDILLLDLKMPVMDGFELSKLLKGSAIYRKIPVIAISASSLREDENEISKYCDGFLRKPVSRAEVVTEMVRFIDADIDVSETSDNGVTDFGSRPHREELSDIKSKVLDGDMDGIISLVNDRLKNTAHPKFYAQIKHLAIACDERAIISMLKQ
ncbi:MAG: ATP-binding protein [Bacteroidota bacterium]